MRGRPDRAGAGFGSGLAAVPAVGGATVRWPTGLAPQRPADADPEDEEADDLDDDLNDDEDDEDDDLDDLDDDDDEDDDDDFDRTRILTTTSTMISWTSTTSTTTMMQTTGDPGGRITRVIDAQPGVARA